MIKVIEKHKCSGCTACASVCPKECITMLEDSEGFIYPSINTEECINCGLCEKTCPILNSTSGYEKSAVVSLDKESLTHQIVEELDNKPKSLVVYNYDTEVRENSTSGGAISAIANYIISMGGVVVGAEFNQDYEVEHGIATDVEEVSLFRGSKYVQSKLDGIFKKIKEYLDDDKWVLYIGTPCQVAGLKAFLHGKEYEKLVAVDVFCHGVGSPLYWKEYIRFIKNKTKKQIQAIKFREKTYGYNSACLAIYFSDGSYIKKGHDEDYYWAAFSKCMIFRPSCYECAFKAIKHSYSDFSVGDYWRADSLPNSFKNANGNSLVIIQSEKGTKILNEINHELEICEVDLEKALLVNGGWQVSKLISSSYMPKERNEVFKSLEKYGFEKTAKRFTSISILVRLKGIIKPILYKTKLLEIVKNIG